MIVPYYHPKVFYQIKNAKINTTSPKMQTITKKLFYFSEDNLKKLCNIYSDKNSNDSWISTNDALVAYIRRTTTRAREIPLDTQFVSLVCAFTCDGRKRLNPPLPSEYFGNCSL